MNGNCKVIRLCALLYPSKTKLTKEIDLRTLNLTRNSRSQAHLHHFPFVAKNGPHQTPLLTSQHSLSRSISPTSAKIVRSAQWRPTATPHRPISPTHIRRINAAAARSHRQRPDRASVRRLWSWSHGCEFGRYVKLFFVCGGWRETWAC